MIFNYNKIIDIIYKKKYQLKKINKNSLEYKNYITNCKNKQLKLIQKFAENINDDFIINLINDDKNIMLFHNIDNCVNVYNITSLIVYRKIYNATKINFIILLIAVHPLVRSVGYGNLILNNFITLITQTKSIKKKYIILHTLDSSLQFYLNYGFYKINSSRFLQDYEGITKKDTLFLKYQI